MRMTPQEALDLFHSDDLVGIGMAAPSIAQEEDRSARSHLPDRPQH